MSQKELVSRNVKYFNGEEFRWELHGNQNEKITDLKYFEQRNHVCICQFLEKAYTANINVILGDSHLLAQLLPMWQMSKRNALFISFLATPVLQVTQYCRFSILGFKKFKRKNWVDHSLVWNILIWKWVQIKSINCIRKYYWARFSNLDIDINRESNIIKILRAANGNTYF